MIRSIALTIAISSIVPGVSVDAAATYDLRSFYPNPTLAFGGYYLDGYNYQSGTPVRSVLWFEDMGSGSFRMYNSLPGERCHYDALKWQSKRLVYSGTHHECEGDVSESIYSPPITFIPRLWSGGAWSQRGSSGVTEKLNGVTVCTGTNTWKAQVFGWIDVAPGQRGIYWRSTQTTKWKTGSCAPFTTSWQEDYIMVPDMGGDAFGPALKRSVGGNLNGGFNWDVWIDGWKVMP